MVAKQKHTPTYAEFFAGGGMVSAALQGDWQCAFANDIDPKKCASYRANFPGNTLIEQDITLLDRQVLLQPIDLYWASSPCQDFSLAGKGAGLGGQRSGVFEQWAGHLEWAVASGFAPRIVAFENVTGLLSRNEGRDFKRVMSSIADCGYRVGAMEIDAARYLPHSRPRLFVVGVRDDVILPDDMVLPAPSEVHFHSKRIQAAVAALPRSMADRIVLWNMAQPEGQAPSLIEMMDITPKDDWFTAPQLSKLLSLMPERHKDRLEATRAKGGREIGFAYKRGRPDGQGGTRQVAEIRFDGVSGCIRTPAGGSSRQTVLVVEDGRVRARLLKPREAIRLMGLSDDYVLPPNFNDGYRIAGDGVVVPIVRDLDRQIFRKLLDLPLSKRAAA